MKNKAAGRPPTDYKSFSQKLEHFDNGCHLWSGSLGRGGYGKVKVKNRTWSTHRFAWFCNFGEIPTGMQINHACDNRRCCNPSHLELGTQKQNIQDALNRGRMATGDRQGLRLHPESRPFGERNGSAKLTVGEVLKIRKSKAAYRIIAERFNIKPVTVSLIRRKLTWTHI